MSKFLEIVTIVFWLMVIVGKAIDLWPDDSGLMLTAVLAALLALLYEVRERKP